MKIKKSKLSKIVSEIIKEHMYKSARRSLEDLNPDEKNLYDKILPRLTSPKIEDFNQVIELIKGLAFDPNYKITKEEKRKYINVLMVARKPVKEKYDTYISPYKNRGYGRNAYLTAGVSGYPYNRVERMNSLISDIRSLDTINESTSRINIKNKLRPMITGKEGDIFNTGASVLESYALSGKSESDEVVSACREFLRDLSIRQAHIGRQLHAIEEYEKNEFRSYMTGFPSSYGAPGQIHVSRDMLERLPSMKKEIKEIVRRKSVLMDIAEEIEGKTLFDRRSITDVTNNPWIMN